MRSSWVSFSLLNVSSRIRSNLIWLAVTDLSNSSSISCVSMSSIRRAASSRDFSNSACKRIRSCSRCTAFWWLVFASASFRFSMREMVWSSPTSSSLTLLRISSSSICICVATSNLPSTFIVSINACRVCSSSLSFVCAASSLVWASDISAASISSMLAPLAFISAISNSFSLMYWLWAASRAAAMSAWRFFSFSASSSAANEVNPNQSSISFKVWITHSTAAPIASNIALIGLILSPNFTIATPIAINTAASKNNGLDSIAAPIVLIAPVACFNPPIIDLNVNWPDIVFNICACSAACPKSNVSNDLEVRPSIVLKLVNADPLSVISEFVRAISAFSSPARCDSFWNSSPSAVAISPRSICISRRNSLMFLTELPVPISISISSSMFNI